MSLTIAAGFVSTTIVMIENIARYWRRGTRPWSGLRLRADRLHHHIADDLADRGAHPAALHGRRGRRLFREFAITLAVTIVIFGRRVLTLVPMMCAKL